MSLIDIFEKFINHLKSLERMLDYGEIIIERYSKKDGDKSDLIDIFILIVDLKVEERKRARALINYSSEII